MPRRTGNGSRSAEAELAKLLAAAAGCRNVVIFSGSGLSAPSGEQGDALRTHKARGALTAWSASQHEAGCACQLNRDVMPDTPDTAGAVPDCRGFRCALVSPAEFKMSRVVLLNLKHVVQFPGEFCRSKAREMHASALYYHIMSIILL